MCAVAHLQCSDTLIFAKYSNPLLGTALKVGHYLNTYKDLL